MWCPKIELIPQHQYRTVTSKQPLNWAPWENNKLGFCSHLFFISIFAFWLKSKLCQPPAPAQWPHPAKILQDFSLNLSSKIDSTPWLSALQGTSYGSCGCDVLYHCRAGFGLAKSNAGRLAFPPCPPTTDDSLVSISICLPVVLKISTKMAGPVPTYPPTKASKSYFLQIHWIEFLLTKLWRASFPKGASFPKVVR